MRRASPLALALCALLATATLAHASPLVVLVKPTLGGPAELPAGTTARYAGEVWLVAYGPLGPVGEPRRAPGVEVELLRDGAVAARARSGTDGAWALEVAFPARATSVMQAAAARGTPVQSGSPILYTRAAVAPGAPSAAGASQDADWDKLALSWAAPADDGNGAVRAFVVSRSEAGGPFAHRATLPPTALGYRDVVLANTSYAYRVAARNIAGESAAAEASALSGPQPPVDQIHAHIEDVRWCDGRSCTDGWTPLPYDLTVHVAGRLYADDLLATARGGEVLVRANVTRTTGCVPGAPVCERTTQFAEGRAAPRADGSFLVVTAATSWPATEWCDQLAISAAVSYEGVTLPPNTWTTWHHEIGPTCPSGIGGGD